MTERSFLGAGVVLTFILCGCQQSKSSADAAIDNGMSAGGTVPVEEVASSAQSSVNDVSKRTGSDGRSGQNLPEWACAKSADCADQFNNIPKCQVAACVNDTGAGQCVLVDSPDGDSCDDGDDCTSDDRCLDGSCSGKQVPGCGSVPIVGDVLCEVFGEAGTQVECPVALVHATKDSRRATGLQFTLNYVPTEAALLRLSCINPKLGSVDSCDLLYQLVPGHTISMLPKKGEWNGTVAAAMYNVGEPLPITDAYYLDTKVVGDSHVITAVFELNADVAKTSPSPVSLSKVTVADFEAIKIKLTVKDGVIRVLDD